MIRSGTAALLTLALGACTYLGSTPGAERSREAAEPDAPGTMEAMSPDAPFVALSTYEVHPGDELGLTAAGFPPDVGVEIGFGPVDSEYEVLHADRTNGDGALGILVTVPESAEADGRYVFVVTTNEGERATDVSDPVEIRMADPTPPR